MYLDDLKNPKLQEKTKAAKTADEMLELIQEAGYELTNDQLDAVASRDALVAAQP